MAKSIFALALLTLAACTSKPKSTNAEKGSAIPAINYAKERSHFMNVSPSVAVGRFRLVDRFCTESTYWYSNLLDYVRVKDRTVAADAPVLSEELVLNADGTFKRVRQITGAPVRESTGTVVVLEQGPTKIMALTHPPKNAKATSDQQAHHRIELTLTEDETAASETVALDLVNSSFDKLVTVAEVHGAVCGARDSLNQVYDRVKP